MLQGSNIFVQAVKHSGAISTGRNVRDESGLGAGWFIINWIPRDGSEPYSARLRSMAEYGSTSTAAWNTEL